MPLLLIYRETKKPVMTCTRREKKEKEKKRGKKRKKKEKTKKKEKKKIERRKITSNLDDQKNSVKEADEERYQSCVPPRLSDHQNGAT